MRPAMLLGCLLWVSPDQDGGRRRREDNLPNPVWGVLLHMHAIRAAKRRGDLSAVDAHHVGPALGKNGGAYIDDIGVKSREAKTLIKDLEEPFASLDAVSL